jgi:ribose transport system permease protein
VTGLIILVAVGIDIVRQSKNPESVRKLLAAIAAVMAFLACMTPGAIYLRAKIAILEHNAAEAMRAAGQQLAPGHNARLLSPSELEAFQTAAQANITAAALLSLLVIAAGYVVFRGKPLLTWLLAAGFVAMIVPLVALGYQITAPFLVLGAVVAMGSNFVFTIFKKARMLDANAS